MNISTKKIVALALCTITQKKIRVQTQKLTATNYFLHAPLMTELIIKINKAINIYNKRMSVEKYKSKQNNLFLSHSLNKLQEI